jgi:hypothetical protein
VVMAPSAARVPTSTLLNFRFQSTHTTIHAPPSTRRKSPVVSSAGTLLSRFVVNGKRRSDSLTHSRVVKRTRSVQPPISFPVVPPVSVPPLITLSLPAREKPPP